MEKFESERNTLFSVILGFIPRIHAEQNLSRHYRACPDNLDPRVKPEDDNRRRMCFTPEDDGDLMVDTRVMPENDKCTIFKGLDVVRQCAALLERRVQSSTRVRKAQAVTRQTNPIGRSMIEMLGVLAIIGVLSVGGIAGYTKAMEKIHVNKIVNMISDISTTIKTAYISQKAYDYFDGGLTEADNQIQDMGLLPPEYTFELEGDKYIGLSSPLTLINPVGISLEDNNDDFSAFSIGVLVPQNLCVPLLTYDWRNADMKGIVIKNAQPDNLGLWVLFAYAALTNFEYNCSESNYQEYYCIELGKQRFKPVSPAVAAKYCESSAEDAFGTGQMYVGFDLLADIKVPRKH